MVSENKKSKRDEEIDANLKRVFQEQLEEEVPDRFKDLMAQLKAKSEQQRSSDAS